MTEYWIPYMWSKRALAKDIIHFIRQHNPKAKYLYDIFWGGGSVSFEALQQGFEKVYYVDLDKWMCNLMEQIKKGIPKEWNKRVSSKEFEELKNKDDAYSVCMSIMWSFGNNRDGYLYSSDIEEWKKALHYAVVDQDYSLLEKQGIDIKLSWKTIKERRLEIKEKIRENERLQHEENLERIQHLERLEHLEIKNLNYKNVKIETPIDETVIYCDPPYRWTAEYKVQEWKFNYKELDKRFRELPCPAYMSEENPHTIALTMSKDRTMMWWAGNKVFEVLYTNWKTLEKKKEVIESALF